MEPQDMNDQELKQYLIEIVVDYGDESIMHSFENINEESENSNVSSSSYSDDNENQFKDSDAIMEDEENKQLDYKVDKYEERYRSLFREMFSDSIKYPSAYSIIKSDKLDWSPTKIKKEFNQFKISGDFNEDKRRTRTPSIKLSEDWVKLLINEWKNDNSISLKRMKEFIYETYEIDVCRTTISNALKNHGFIYQGIWLRPKIQK